jgi:hypothetical protein
MLKLLARYRVFIISLPLLCGITYGSFVLVVRDIFGSDIKYLTTLGIVTWDILCAPLGYLLHYIFSTNEATGAGVAIDIILYSLLFQFLWNRYQKKRKKKPTT